MNLAIFDIDGTLTDSCAFDDALYAEAVRNVLKIQISCAWERYKDVTDSGIIATGGWRETAVLKRAIR